MVPVSIQFSSEQLCSAEILDLCESLKTHSVRLLSLRGCQISDSDFLRICRTVAQSRYLSQLNLSLGVVSGSSRTLVLAQALKENRSLQTLLLHGSPLQDSGLLVLNQSLSFHPGLVSLDLGDCSLGDQALGLICGLLPPDGAKSGLKELTLSANPGISARGWTRLSIAVAHSSQLRVLNLDYNPLGDHVAEMLAVATASSRTLEVLDLEGTGLTNHSAQVFLDVVLFYPTSLKVLVLSENHVSPDLQTQIRELLTESKDQLIREQRLEWQRPIREQRLSQQPIRQQLAWPHSGAHTVLLTSGLGDSLLDETEM